MSEITFENHDKFDRLPFAKRLTKAITTFFPFADGAYVISLNAKFGSGKTTFLTMWEHYLRQQEQGYTVIPINAWETDFADDPILPIATAFLNAIPDNTKGKKVKNALQKAAGAAAVVGNMVVEKYTGIDVLAVGQNTEKHLKEGDLIPAGKELFKVFGYKQQAFKELKAALADYVAQLDKKPLIVLVDELDRARPNYSVEFLETIKHIFSVQGVCFVLAVDRNQLQSSVKQLYGQDTDFNNYYRRFITREVRLPEARLQPFIRQQYTEYFERKEYAHLKFGISQSSIERFYQMIEFFAKNFDFNARQIQHLFRNLNYHFLSDGKQHLNDYNWVCGYIFLAALSLYDEKIYHRIGREEIEPKELYKWLVALPTTQQRDPDGHWNYTTETIFAFCLTRNNSRSFAQELFLLTHDQQEQTDEETLDVYTKRLAAISHRHGLPNTSNFSYIYKRLENWRTFFEPDQPGE